MKNGEVHQNDDRMERVLARLTTSPKWCL